MRRRVVGLSVIVALACGCSASRPGVSRTGSGYYEKYVPAPQNVVHAAAQRVFKRVELMTVSDELKDGVYVLTARDHQDTQVTAKIESQGESTYVALRVKPGWSEEYSLRLLKMINEEAKASAQN